MNPLAFLPSLPLATTAINAATRGVGQAVNSFAEVLEAATGASNESDAAESSSARPTLELIQQELGRQLGAAHIEWVDDVRLRVDRESGQIVVTGDPASRAAVEQALEENPDLADMLREVIAAQDSIYTGQSTLRFSLDGFGANAKFV
jgi:hypothetical protein